MFRFVLAIGVMSGQAPMILDGGNGSSNAAASASSLESPVISGVAGIAPDPLNSHGVQPQGVIIPGFSKGAVLQNGVQPQFQGN